MLLCKRLPLSGLTPMHHLNGPSPISTHSYIISWSTLVQHTQHCNWLSFTYSESAQRYRNSTTMSILHVEDECSWPLSSALISSYKIRPTRTLLGVRSVVWMSLKSTMLKRLCCNSWIITSLSRKKRMINGSICCRHIFMSLSLSLIPLPPHPSLRQPLFLHLSLLPLLSPYLPHPPLYIPPLHPLSIVVTRSTHWTRYAPPPPSLWVCLLLLKTNQLISLPRLWTLLNENAKLRSTMLPRSDAVSLLWTPSSLDPSSVYYYFVLFSSFVYILPPFPSQPFLYSPLSLSLTLFLSSFHPPLFGLLSKLKLYCSNSK